MTYLAASIWCIFFGSVSAYLLHQRWQHKDYQSFLATVKEVKKSPGNHRAIVESKFTSFEITFQDLGEYKVGQELSCMWDGKESSTAQLDLRHNQLLAICFCFGALLLMVAILAII